MLCVRAVLFEDSRAHVQKVGKPGGCPGSQKKKSARSGSETSGTPLTARMQYCHQAAGGAYTHSTALAAYGQFWQFRFQPEL